MLQRIRLAQLLVIFIVWHPSLSHATSRIAKVNTPIKMCINPDRMPFEGINRQGEHIGIIADFMRLLAKKMHQPIILVKTQNWTQSLDSVQQNRCDILSSATKTLERSHFLNFSLVILEYPLVLATRSDTEFIVDIQQVLNHRFAVVQDDPINETLQHKYPSLKITPVINTRLGLAMVTSGKIFAYIDSAARISYQAQKSGLLTIKIAGVLDDKYKLSVAISKDKPLLLTQFNTAISQISEQERMAILNKWLAINYQQVTYRSNTPFQTTWQYLSLGAILILLLSVCLWLFYQKRQLKQSIQALVLEKPKLEKNAQSIKFAEMISHEYRTPVTIISTNLDILELKDQQNKLGLSSQIIKMRDSVTRLIALVETALNREKLLTLPIIIKRIRFDFTYIVEQAITDLSYSYPNHSITIQSHFKKIPFYGDPESLILLLKNLLENAFKYSPNNEPVILSLEYNDQQLIFEVRDQGIGIAHADMEYIFDKYHRAANSANISGIGLGLYMAKSIVVQHNGEINITCPPDGGTQVQVIFPIDTTKL